MLEELHIATKDRIELIDITAKVEAAVRSSKTKSGTCHVFVPHTTAGVTVNENADPCVRRDIIAGLGKIAPAGAGYEHAEGNADSHIKSSLVGTDKTVLIESGRLKLGAWQGIFLCEFDGPRRRTVLVKIMEG